MQVAPCIAKSNMSAIARAVNQATRQAGRAMSTEVAGIKKVCFWHQVPLVLTAPVIAHHIGCHPRTYAS